MVFQRFNLFRHMTALENVIEAPVHVKGMSRSLARRQAEELLDRVGLADKAQTLSRRSCPAGSSSGSRSRARWR